MISKEYGERFAKENNMDYFAETSSKLGIKVHNILIQAAKILYISYFNNNKVTKKQFQFNLKKYYSY